MASPSILSVVLLVGVALYRFSSSAEWEKVNAVITKSELESVSQGMLASSSNGGNRISYKVNVEYVYSVSGVDYIGNNIYAGIGGMIADKAEAQNLIAQYALGDNVVIYYNLEDPNDSALRSSKGFVRRLVFVVVLILILGGAILSLVLKRLDF